MSRTTELVLGLLGGIFGLFASFFVMAFGGLGGALGAQGASGVVGQGMVAIIFSIVGIVGASLVKSKTKLSGWMMLISAIGGIISISLAYLISFILLIIAGIMALVKKDK